LRLSIRQPWWPTHLARPLSTMEYCTQWQKPPPGQLKLNWDAAVDHRSKLMGVGIVIRDHDGFVRVAKCTTIRYVADPLVADTPILAARMGVSALEQEGDVLGRYGSIVMDIYPYVLSSLVFTLGPSIMSDGNAMKWPTS